MRIFKLISDTLAVLTGLAILVASLLVTYAAVARFFFGQSTSAQLELATYLLMASVWIGAAPTLLAGRHVAIKLISDKVRPSGAKFLARLGFLTSVLIGLVLTIYSYHMLVRVMREGWRSGTVWNPHLTLPYSMLPIGFGLFTLVGLVLLVRSYTHGKCD